VGSGASEGVGVASTGEAPGSPEAVPGAGTSAELPLEAAGAEAVGVPVTPVQPAMTNTRAVSQAT
jgi:hypothetical protein